MNAANETKKATHTPGPWKYSFESIDPEWAVVHNTLGGPVIANVNANHRQEANAQLISAAPDLLEALQRMLDGHQVAIDNADARRTNPKPRTCECGACDEARKAMAKAVAS